MQEVRVEHSVLHAAGCQVTLRIKQIIDVEVRTFGSYLPGAI